MKKIIMLTVLTLTMLTNSANACFLIERGYNNYAPIQSCNPIEQENIIVPFSFDEPAPIPSFAQPFFSVGFGVPMEKFNPMPHFGSFPVKPPTNLLPGGPGDYIPPHFPRVPEPSTLANLFIGLLLVVFFSGCVWVRRRTMKDL